MYTLAQIDVDAATPGKPGWRRWSGPALVVGGVGLIVAAVLIGRAIVNYTDRKSFAKMMDQILSDLGVSDPEARLGIIAHAGVETRMGTAGSAQPKTTFNFWNITAGKYWTGKTLAGGDTEYGKAITQAWRVYDSPEESAKDYLDFLSSTQPKLVVVPGGGLRTAAATYKDALDKLFAGDVKGFVYTLRDAGYYTAPADTYFAMIQGQMSLARGYLFS